MSSESWIKNVDGLSDAYDLASVHDTVESGVDRSYMGLDCQVYCPKLNKFIRVGSNIWPVAAIKVNGGESFVVLKFKTIFGEFKAAIVPLSDLNSNGSFSEAFSGITHSNGQARVLDGLARLIGFWLDFGEPKILTYDAPKRSMRKSGTLSPGVDRFF